MQNFTLQLESIDGGDAVILGGTIVATEAVVGGMDSSSNHFAEFIIIFYFQFSFVEIFFFLVLIIF